MDVERRTIERVALEVRRGPERLGFIVDLPMMGGSRYHAFYISLDPGAETFQLLGHFEKSQAAYEVLVAHDDAERELIRARSVSE